MRSSGASAHRFACSSVPVRRQSLFSGQQKRPASLGLATSGSWWDPSWLEVGAPGSLGSPFFCQEVARCLRGCLQCALLAGVMTWHVVWLLVWRWWPEVPRPCFETMASCLSWAMTAAPRIAPTAGRVCTGDWQEYLERSVLSDLG